MKKPLTFIALFLLLLTQIAIFSGCSENLPSETKEIVLQVNDSKLTLEEFNDLLKFEANIDPEMYLNRDNRDQFIDYLIQKELLIAEASRLKLDREQNFIKTIEKYWESTLIRNLMEYKSNQLQKKVLITEEEAQAYYKNHTDRFDMPFAKAKARIKKILESKEIEKRIEQWTESLRQKATIKISKTLTRQAQNKE